MPKALMFEEPVSVVKSKPLDSSYHLLRISESE